jgi:L-asparaginase / beta-aspartyl-peptidase
MRYLLILFKLFIATHAFTQTGGKPKENYVLVIHGGAGTILKSQMTPEAEKAYTEALATALKKGHDLLKNGASALDAVEAAVRSMEDNPLFNAGKGAVFTNEGKNELDAAIMDGKTRAAGAVAGITTVKNPISAAMMMIGTGAEKFAAATGLEIVDPAYFHTESRWRALQSARQADSLKNTPDHADTSNKTSLRFENRDDKFGTVGAVALDRSGNLAAATSTGGMTNKKFGRVGDVPVIGAGTYAYNKTCAVSCTGYGEYFIRLVMSKTVSDMIEYGKMSLKEAANEMIMKQLPRMGGDGGLIAIDKNGNFTMPFNTSGMYRGVIKADGKMEIGIYWGSLTVYR